MMIFIFLEHYEIESNQIKKGNRQTKPVESTCNSHTLLDLIIFLKLKYGFVVLSEFGERSYFLTVLSLSLSLFFVSFFSLSFSLSFFLSLCLFSLSPFLSL